MGTNRDTRIDILKGCGILCVIIGHLTTINALRAIIYSFHMPLFFFLSGYCFKYQQCFGTVVVKLSKSLLIPYLLFATFVVMVMVYTHRGGYIETLFFADGFYNHTMIMPNSYYIGALWFLPALFWCRICYNWLYKYKYIHLNSIIISIMSFLLGKFIINIPFGLLEGMQALVFYDFGMLLRNSKILNLKRISLYSLPIWILGVIVGGMSMADFSYRCYPINVLGALAAIIILFGLVDRYFNNNQESFIDKGLAWIGRNSLYYFGIHAVIQSMHIKGNWYIIFIIQMMVCTICTYIYKLIKK